MLKYKYLCLFTNFQFGKIWVWNPREHYLIDKFVFDITVLKATQV